MQAWLPQAVTQHCASSFVLMHATCWIPHVTNPPVEAAGAAAALYILDSIRHHTWHSKQMMNSLLVGNTQRRIKITLLIGFNKSSSSHY